MNETRYNFNPILMGWVDSCQTYDQLTNLMVKGIKFCDTITQIKNFLLYIQLKCIRIRESQINKFIL